MEKPMRSFELERPRLRPLEMKWVQEGAGQVLYIRDPSGIAPNAVFVPPFVAIVLSFCDGQRDLPGIRAEFEQRTGQPISLDQLTNILRQIDEALFLDSPRFRATRGTLIDDFRGGASRAPALAGRAYPAEPAALLEELRGYGTGLLDDETGDPDLRGIVSPHIDYQRGGPIYATTWKLATEAVRQADLVVVFGTDHCGGPGQVTLTRQSYATPFGVLPTAVDVVDAVAAAIGPDDAYAEEIHHRNEHSIELATVWLHSIRPADPPRVVPILCGSFHYYSNGEADLEADDRLNRTIDSLRAATAGQRVLAVAAADLAHVGPSFGDSQPYGDADRRQLEAKDESLLRSICEGDARGFFGQLRAEQDCRRICGLPPIYLM
ncbi:MAG: AmmeMemoRadiSam system protein B, partial [Chloroflexota bacterium]